MSLAPALTGLRTIRPIIIGAAALVGLAAFQVACTTTSVVGPNALRQSLATVERSQVVMTALDGSTVRIDPSSKVRFLFADNLETPWIPGSALSVSTVGVHAGGTTFPWKEIEAVKVKNFSGGKTAAVTIFSAAVVVALVAYLMSDNDEKSSESKAADGAPGTQAKTAGSGVRGGRRSAGARGVAAETATRGAAGAKRPRGASTRSKPRGSVTASGHGAGGGVSGRNRSDSGRKAARRGGPRIRGGRRHGAGGVVVGASLELHGRTRVFEGRGPSTMMRPSKYVLDAVPRSLFSWESLRRRRYQIVGAVAGGYDLSGRGDVMDSALVGIRMRDLFEIGIGMRQMATRISGGARRDEFEWEHLAFARLGLHFELDSGRFVSLPFSVDLGTDFGGMKHVKVNLGLRFSVGRYLTLGIYPFNPSYSGRQLSDALADNEAWTFPSTAELGFNF